MNKTLVHYVNKKYNVPMEIQDTFTTIADLRDLQATLLKFGFLSERDYERLAKDVSDLSDPDDIRHAAEKTLLSVGFVRDLIVTDDLTGITNHGYFKAKLKEAVDAAGRQHDDHSDDDLTKRAYIFVDLAGLKGINDSLGQAAGDAALKRAAEILSELVRRGESVSRIGGDEFAMIAIDPKGHIDFPDKVVDRLKTALEKATFEYDGQEYELRFYVAAVVIDGSQDADAVHTLAGKKINEIKAAAKADRSARPVPVAPSGMA